MRVRRLVVQRRSRPAAAAVRVAWWRTLRRAALAYCALAMLATVVAGLHLAGEVRIVPAPADLFATGAGSVVVEIPSSTSTVPGGVLAVPAQVPAGAVDWYAAELAAGWQPQLQVVGAGGLLALLVRPWSWLLVAATCLAAAHAAQVARRMATRWGRGCGWVSHPDAGNVAHLGDVGPLAGTVPGVPQSVRIGDTVPPATGLPHSIDGERPAPVRTQRRE